MATRQSSCRTVWPGEMSWLATNTRPTPGLEDSVNNLDIWNVVGKERRENHRAFHSFCVARGARGSSVKYEESPQ